jgi:flagellar hook-associated protein 3 FlgL
MNTIPANLARVPNMLTSRLSLGTLSRSTRDLIETQLQLTTGLRINRPSDDPIGTSTISVLDDILERRDQRLRNMDHAESLLNTIDAALGDMSTILIEAKGIASSQIGVGSDAATRENQAGVINAMLDEMINIANRKYQQVYFFGGDATADSPLESLNGGLRYIGLGDGLVTDLGMSRPMPVTVSGAEAFGTLSNRVQGNVDLNPTMTADTRLRRSQRRPRTRRHPRHH